MAFLLVSVALFVAATVYSVVTQRLLRAAGKRASWLLALALGVFIAFVMMLTQRASIADFSRGPCYAISLLAASLPPFLGAATGFALTAREGLSPRAQLTAALALAAAASLAAPGLAVLLAYLLPGDCA